MTGNSQVDFARYTGSRKRAVGLLLICSISFLVLENTRSTAQTASQTTPSNFEPAPQRAAEAIVFSDSAGLAPPPGAENLSILISGVQVDGTLSGMEQATGDFEGRVTRGRIPVSEVFEAAADLERAYIEAGFILARVVLPEQRLDDGGTLRVVVIDGFVEAVDTTNVPADVRPRIEQLTNSLVGQRSVTLSEIERRLLLAGDIYGVALQSALSAGGVPGGTVVVLEPEFRPVTGFVGVDNAQSDGLGEWNLDLGVELNGLLNLGEVFYGRLSGYPGDIDETFSNDARRKAWALGAVVPVGNDGLTVNLEHTESDNRPEVSGPLTESEYDRTALRLFYPWIRSRNRNVNLQAGLDIVDDNLDLDTSQGALPIYEDELSVLRFSADASWLRTDSSFIQLGAILSVGVDAFGARTESDAEGSEVPLSRAGADATFTKLELSGRYRQPLANDFDIVLSGRTQISFGDPLLVSEQFGIANIYELSAFDSGTLNGDNGFVVRGEFGRNFRPEIGGRAVNVRPYAFGAFGRLNVEEPLFGESSDVDADAIGFGVETFFVGNSRFSNASLRLEYGTGNRDDGGRDEDRVLLVGAWRF